MAAMAEIAAAIMPSTGSKFFTTLLSVSLALSAWAWMLAKASLTAPPSLSKSSNALAMALTQALSWFRHAFTGAMSNWRFSSASLALLSTCTTNASSLALETATGLAKLSTAGPNSVCTWVYCSEADWPTLFSDKANSWLGETQALSAVLTVATCASAPCKAVSNNTDKAVLAWPKRACSTLTLATNCWRKVSIWASAS